MVIKRGIPPEAKRLYMLRSLSTANATLMPRLSRHAVTVSVSSSRAIAIISISSLSSNGELFNALSKRLESWHQVANNITNLRFPSCYKSSTLPSIVVILSIGKMSPELTYSS